MSHAQDFQANAVECDKQAADASDPEAKRFFQEAAREWRKLAERARLDDLRSLN